MGSAVKAVNMVVTECEVVSIDVFQRDHIVGWYYCYSGTANRLAIKIGDRETIEISCDGHRPDVFESSFGIADCGFDIKLAPSIASDEFVEIASVATGRTLYRGSLSKGLENPDRANNNFNSERALIAGSRENRPKETSASLPDIVIDISDFVYYIGHQSNLTGIQRFQSCVILSIVKNFIFPTRNIFFITYDHGEKTFSAIDTKFFLSLLQDLMKPAPERTIAYDRDQAKRGVFPNSTKLDKVLKKEREAIFFLMGAGWGNPTYFTAIAELKRKYKAPFVTLIYDLIPIYAPDIGDLPTSLQFGKFLDGALRWSDRLLSLSEYTTFDLKRYAADRSLPLPELAVTQAGSSFAEFSAGGDISQPIEGIEGPFALFVATIEGRKNHKLVFDAWSRLVRDLPDPPTLICVGRFGWRVEDFMQGLVETNYLGGKILILEDVADSELNWLYRKCLFTLFPSSYEGWGLPVGEALSHGKICIASRKTSVPEVGADQAVYVDIDDPASLYGTIHRLIVDTPYRLELEKAVVDNYHPIPWRLVAQRIVDGCLSVRSAEPKRIWPELKIGREYVFRDAPLPSFGGTGPAFIRRLKDARRGILKSAALTDENFHAVTDAMTGPAWLPTEDWGVWSLYDHVPELRFSLPSVGLGIEWYISLRVCHPLAGRSCRVMVGQRLFCDILLPRVPTFVRLGQISPSLAAQDGRYSVRFLIDKEDATREALRATDGRILGVGFERMLFLETHDYDSRMDLLEAQMNGSSGG